MRVVGIDLGTRRIGVAVSDSAGAVATPYSMIERGPDHRGDHDEIARVVEELGAARVVVGLPVSLDGRAGTAARASLEEAGELAERLRVEVCVHDERLTTVTAGRAIRDLGVKRSRRRKVVDAMAAAVMLQSWLDRGRE